MRFLLQTTTACTHRAVPTFRFRAPALRSRRSCRPKVLLLAAHPDDEHVFAGPIYRLARELGGTVDQVVITDGAGGFRYSGLAEKIYRTALANDEFGKARLPKIRKRETLEAGKALDIQRHYFLEQPDPGFTLDAAEGERIWNCGLVCQFPKDLLDREGYDSIFKLLPTEDTHGHHKTAAALAKQTVPALHPDRRPVIVGGYAGERAWSAAKFENDPVNYEFSRTATARSSTGLPSQTERFFQALSQ